VVRGTTPEGDRTRGRGDRFEARAFQHELDHLDGLLILDRVASARTDVFRRKRYADRGEHLK
jgi:peptide deformylase